MSSAERCASIGFATLPREDTSAGKYDEDDVSLSDHARERIRVLVVDDEQHVRENSVKLALAVGAEGVGAVATGEEGIELARKLQSHIVLMDRLMPGMDGLKASQTITEKVLYTRIIMTAVQGAEPLRRSMLTGARDCLSGPLKPERSICAAKVGRRQRSVGRSFLGARSEAPETGGQL